MNSDEFDPEYMLRCLEDPDYLWPEDVITEEEWNRGWLDRKIIAGERRPEDRATTPAEFGGDLR